jgi:hypothetical protein
VILDRAGWHRSQGLVVPGNITLLELPPYSPELNPVERIWRYLRSHWLANSVFTSLAEIMDTCEMARNRFATNRGLVRSLCAVAWAPASPALWVVLPIEARPSIEAHSCPEISEDPYYLPIRSSI